MVNKRPINQTIFRAMYRRSPNPELSSWDYVVEELVSELKHERNAYYGTEGSEEEKAYPGFDYTNSKIQARLIRWPSHSLFFKALNSLNLSTVELDSVTTWWGTAKHRRLYEEQMGHKIRDTLDDEIPTEEEFERAKREAQQRKEFQDMMAYTFQQTELESFIKSSEHMPYLPSIQALRQAQNQAYNHFPYLMEQFLNFSSE